MHDRRSVFLYSFGCMGFSLVDFLMTNFFRFDGIAATIMAGPRDSNEHQQPRKAVARSSGNSTKAVSAPSPDAVHADRLNRLLTLRQRQIVAMLKSGSSNKEIAQELGLAEGTVKVHLHSIYQRVGVSSRRQLVSRLFVE
jgi:DNA-binding NarL/FixJ family response regulator